MQFFLGDDGYVISVNIWGQRRGRREKGVDIVILLILSI